MSGGRRREDIEGFGPALRNSEIILAAYRGQNVLSNMRVGIAVGRTG